MNWDSRYLAKVAAFGVVRIVVVAFCVCLCHHVRPSDGKVFERCELAQLLRYGHGLDVNDVASWVCIAQHSSSLNTSAFGGNVRSGSHGLFQINDQYWCSPPGKGFACGLTCDRLRDDDISDDLDCVQTIYQEHQRLSGDGYNAWTVYQLHCRENPIEYVEDCFGNEEQEYLHAKSITANSVQYDGDKDDEEEFSHSKKRGKVYKRCELAKELFLRHKMPIEEISTWVCIVQHESNYNTAAVGRLNTDGSTDHGLFQINDLYWCSQKGGRRKACGIPCSKLLDSDITDDIKCMKQIRNEHARISGDGFTAWTVYNDNCNNNTDNYVRGCFDGIDTVSESKVDEKYQPLLIQEIGGNERPHGKIYEPCELAEELRTRHHLPEDQIATWVCIAKYESQYNTSAIGYGDHGLFQISDIYWCSPPGKGFACELSCADLEDSDISDDVECIRKIYKEHAHLSGDGFNAWTVYSLHCSDGRADKYISDCPVTGRRPAITSPPYTHSQLNSNSISDNHNKKKGKVYGRCELANELLNKYKIPMEEISTWVCIAYHESNFDTSSVGRRNIDGSADHGIFQISDIYWCSHKEGQRKACGIPCNKLLDNDISDDMECVKQIYDEHTRISGDGFTAWTVYVAYCQERTEQYVQGCFDGSAAADDFKSAPNTVDNVHVAKNKPRGKIYEECELAKELSDKYRMPNDQIATWVCIAKYQSGLNTSSTLSNVHGLFHISDEFWCSPPGKGQACELHCSDLEDSDISDDIDCIRKIYLEHQRISGDGFNAWVVYQSFCSEGRADEYISHCSGFKATATSAIAHGQQKGVIKVHPKLGGGVIQIENRPIYNHAFKANPFLRHFKTVSKDAAFSLYSGQSEHYSSGSGKDDEVVPVTHAYTMNPFLKRIPSEEERPTVIQIKNKPIYNHAFSENPFLRHFKTSSSDAAFTLHAGKSEEYSSRSEQKDGVVPVNHVYTMNPFLKRIPSEEERPNATQIKNKPIYDHAFYANPFLRHFETVSSDAYSHGYTLNPFLKRIPSEEERSTLTTIKTKTSSPTSFVGFPITPTPTKISRLQTYQPENEERAKYEVFRAHVTPSLPVITQTPKINRLQTYQPKTLKTLPTPLLPRTTTQAPATYRLKPYQFNRFESFAMPTIQPISTNTFTTKPIDLPAVKTSTKPITTPIKAAQVAKGPGQYVTGKYDSGMYDPKRHGGGRYIQSKHPLSIITNVNSNSATKTTSGEISTEQSKTRSTDISITSTSQAKPFFAATEVPGQSQATKSFPSYSANFGQYEATLLEKPPSTTSREVLSTMEQVTQSPTTEQQSTVHRHQQFKSVARLHTPTPTFFSTIVSIPKNSRWIDPFKPFSTIKPITTNTASNSGKYVQHSNSRDSGQYVPYKKQAAPPQTTELNFQVKTASPTRKFDPFKPFTTRTYDPFAVFNTGKHKLFSTFNLPSGNEASNNELDSEPSSNSKTGTAQSSSTNIETNSNEVASSSSRPKSTIISATPVAFSKLSSTQGISLITATPTGSAPNSRSVIAAAPTRSVINLKPAAASTSTTSTSARSPGILILSPTITPTASTGSAPATKLLNQIASTRSAPISGSVTTIVQARTTSSTSKSAFLTATTRPTSVIRTKPFWNQQHSPFKSTDISRQTQSLDADSSPTIITTQRVIETDINEPSTPRIQTSPTRSSTIITSTATLIRPTKPLHSSDVLFSTKLFDLYYKLYGVHIHPNLTNETSSGVEHAIKTTQTNYLIPSRTS